MTGIFIFRAAENKKKAPENRGLLKYKV